MEPVPNEARIEDKEPTLCQPEKKTWVEPEITWHQRLQSITLGIYCNSSVPPCTSPTAPVV